MKQIKMLTGLRGLAALVVFISHAANSGFIPSIFGRGFGQVGVMLFFVLSGFLMAHLYLRSSFEWANVAKYALARIARVVPLYLAVVFLSLLISNYLYAGFRYEMKDVETLLLAALFLHARQELWTIPVEVQFYVLFVVFWYLFQRGWSTWRLVVFAAATVLPALAIAILARERYSIVSTYSHAFFLGAFSGLLWDSHIRPFFDAHPRLADGIGIVFFALLFVNLPGLRTRLGLVIVEREYVLTWLDPLTWIVVYGLFLSCVIRSSSLRFLESRPFAILGSISYGFYLVHLPVLLLLREKFGAGPVVLIAGFFLVLALAYGSFRFFERPVRARIRAWQSARTGPSQPVPAETVVAWGSKTREP